MEVDGLAALWPQAWQPLGSSGYWESRGGLAAACFGNMILQHMMRLSMDVYLPADCRLPEAAQPNQSGSWGAGIAVRRWKGCNCERLGPRWQRRGSAAWW